MIWPQAHTRSHSLFTPHDGGSISLWRRSAFSDRPRGYKTRLPVCVARVVCSIESFSERQGHVCPSSTGFRMLRCVCRVHTVFERSPWLHQVGLKLLHLLKTLKKPLHRYAGSWELSVSATSTFAEAQHTLGFQGKLWLHVTLKGCEAFFPGLKTAA